MEEHSQHIAGYGPAIRMPAERTMLPAGVLLRYDWLQRVVCCQLRHTQLTSNREPLVVDDVVTSISPQRPRWTSEKSDCNSSSSAIPHHHHCSPDGIVGWVTIYTLLFHSLSLSVLSLCKTFHSPRLALADLSAFALYFS